MTQYIHFPQTGGVPTYPDQASLPASAGDGSLAVTLDTESLWIYDAPNNQWLLISNSGAALMIGPIDTGTPSNDGAQILSNALIMQSASATKPGLVNNTTQSFSGNKTFTGTIAASNFSGSSSGTNTGDVTLNSVGSSPNANAASLSGQVLTLQPADATNPGLISTAAQDIPGAKSFLAPISIQSGVAAAKTIYVPNGPLSGSNPQWEAGFRAGQPYYSIVMYDGSSRTTFVDFGLNGIIDFPTVVSAPNLRTTNIATIAGDTIMSLTVSNQALTVTSGNDDVQLAVKANGTQTQNLLEVQNSSGTPLMTVSAAGAIAASNFSGSSSGSNTGDVTLGSVGSSPNGNAASLSGQVLTLQPADGSNPGVITAGTQSIGGAKTFTGAISASNLSGTNTGDISLSAVGSSPNANGASLTGQVLNLQAADGSNPGALTAIAQSIGGIKTFASAPVLSALTASQVVVTDAGKALASLAYASANTALALVQRDGSGNFAAGTITAALTGTASGNTTISAQTNHGVVIASSTNAMTSTGAGSAGQVLTSNGASSDPTFQAPAGGASSFTMTSQSTTYAAVINDYVLVTKGSAWTITLPTAVGQSGKSICILITDNNPANALTINTTSAQTIDGAASGARKMYTLKEFAQFTSDGANWVVTGRQTVTKDEAYTPTFVGFGTISSTSALWYRQGEKLFIKGTVVTGTATSTDQTVSVPAFAPLNTTIMSFSGILGHALSAKATSGDASCYTSGRVADLFWDGSSTTALYFTTSGQNGGFTKTQANGWIDNATAMKFWSEGLPITGWDW